MIAALLFLLSTAWAGPCEDAGDGFVVGPVAAGFADGGLATPQRTCPRSEFGVGAGGRLTVQPSEFYGYVVGGLVLDGSYAVTPNVEVFGRLEAVRYDLAVASLTSSALGLGHLSVGAAYGTDATEDVAVGVRGTLVLPTATGLYHNGRPLAGDLGITSVWRPHPMIRLHDALGAQLIGAVGGPALVAGGLTANLGLEVRPVAVFGLVVDLDASFLRTAVVDHVAVGAALRFGDGKRFGFELGGRVPLAGRERALASLLLRGSVRFGPIAGAR